MKKKQGISLIVLVITIIVMIILAASVVITLSNTGVINRASQAVDLTNERQVQDLATMIWAEAYLDKTKTDTIEKIVKDKLAEQGITDEKWDIVVSTTGVSVTTKKESEWPVTWNMAEISNNTSIEVDGIKIYKVSDETPSEGKIARAMLSTPSFDISAMPFLSEENITAVFCADDTATNQLYVFAVFKDETICQGLGGAVFPETGLYIADVTGNLNGKDIDVTLRTSNKTYDETISDSWSEIKAHIDAGDYKEHYKLGDTKMIECSDGYTMLMEIVAFDADTKEDGTKAPLTWMSKHIVYTHKMNSSDTIIGGWKDSEVRAWLRNDFYDILPSEVKESIVLVDKTYYDFETRSTLSCTDSLWIPSQYEVFAAESDSGAYRESLGADYSSYFTSDEARVKFYGSTSIALPWWLRSTSGFVGGQGFSFVNEDGTECSSRTGTRANDSLGIVFGFCM